MFFYSDSTFVMIILSWKCEDHLEELVVAQWIRPQTLNHEVPGSKQFRYHCKE